MNQKVEKPTLSGQRIKTRKRDEKEKYDPNAFRDSIIQGFIEADSSLEQLSKFLDSAGAKLDYRRYAETLLDILFAGGILEPGGFIREDGGESEKATRTRLCVFCSEDNVTALQAYYEVLYKLIRRYKYLEKSLNDELKKLIVFLKGFQEEERKKLAQLYGILFANGLGNPQCLHALFEEHLVKEGLALEFATHLFQQWLTDKDINNISTTLKRVGLEGKLLNLLPINKRTQENFENHFKVAGLQPIIDYQRVKATVEVKKELQRELAVMIKDEESCKEMLTIVKESMEKNGIPEHEVIVMVWSTIMNAVEWNKKEELVADQAMKHLKLYSPVFSALTNSPKSELTLILKIQEYCYDNMNFFKAFQKIIVLFYKTDVLGEDTIVKWYREAHSQKGKSVFLEQMKKMIEWLENAEEESEEDD